MKVIRVYKTEVFTVEIELYMFTTGKNINSCLTRHYTSISKNLVEDLQSPGL